MDNEKKHDDGTPCDHGYGAIIPSYPPHLDKVETPTAGTPPPDTDHEDMDTPVQDQGRIGACTAFGGCACLEHEQKRQGYETVTKLCELDLYYRDRQVAGLPTDQDTGSYPAAVADACRVYGVCPEDDRPYDPARFTEAPDANMQAHEGQFKIDSSRKLTGDVISQMWDCVRNNVPFYICFNVYQSFESVGSSGKVPAVRSGEQVLGGHCVKGGSGWYNDQSAWGGVGYFKCKNSWSTLHGDRGYYYFPTGYFTAGIVTDVYVMTLPQQTTPTDDKSAEIVGICQEVQRLITDAQSTGWTDPNVQSELGSIYDYMNYIVADVEQTPLSNDDQGTVKGICWECQRLITIAQQTGWADANVRSYLGSIKDYMNQIMSLLTEPPPPPPTSKYHAPVDPGAWVGINKWMHDGPNGESMGCDMFIGHNSPVYACVDGVIEELIPGQGISGGAEFILSATDKSDAFRYRHVQSVAGIRVGTHVVGGQQIGIVQDKSLNQLCSAPIQGFPDGWQHCDLSYDQGTDQFSPLGGGGGNKRAFDWLVQIGYQAGRVMQQTPGPTSCGMSEDEASEFLVSGVLPDGYGKAD